MGRLIFSITNVFQLLMFSCSSSSGGGDDGGGDDGGGDDGGGDDGRGGDDGGCLRPQMLAGFRL